MMPRLIKRALAAMLCAAGLMAAGAPSARADDNATWALLKKPGHILLLRHSNSPESPPDGDHVDFKNCETQRKLDAAGRAQAKRLGDEFRKHGVARLRILSSQYCRAVETGKLTGLGPVKELPALNQVYLADLGGMREAGDKGRAFMKIIPAKQLTMLVSHVTNIQAIAGVSLSSGEVAVVHLNASGAVEIDGRIKVP